MTDWFPTADAGSGGDATAVMTQSVPRLARRSALRPAASRRMLYANAAEQARLVRGRETFVWRGRVLPIGIPLASAAGLVTWRQRRSTRGTLAAIFGLGVASYLEA